MKKLSVLFVITLMAMQALFASLALAEDVSLSTTDAGVNVTSTNATLTTTNIAADVDLDSLDSEDISTPPTTAEVDNTQHLERKAFLIEVLWGDLDKSVDKDAAASDWSGSLSSEGADISVLEEVKFENNDSFVEESDSKIIWTSEIQSYNDGLIIKAFPTKDEMSFTFSSERLGTKTFTYEELKDGEILTFDGGYKMAIKLHDPLKFRSKFRNSNMLVLVRWGNLDGTYDKDAEAFYYTGSLESEGFQTKFVSEVLFEDNDEVTEKTSNTISWDSNIKGHYDGIILRVKSVENGVNTFTRLSDISTVSTTPFMTAEKKRIEVESTGLNAVPVATGVSATEILSEESSSLIEEGEDASAEVSKDYDYEDLEMNDATEDRSVTLTIGNFTKTFYSEDDFGIFDLGEGNQVEVINLMKLVGDLDQENVEKILKNKIKMQTKCSVVYTFIKNTDLELSEDLVTKLVSICDKASQYNFDDESVEEFLAEFDEIVKYLRKQGVNKEDLEKVASELEAAFEKIKESAKLRKFTQGIIPFKDVDDAKDVWYSDFVLRMVERKIVSGYADTNGNPLGEYRPNNFVSVGEILKIALLGAGHVIVEYPDMEYPESVKDHWARDYFTLAKNMSFDIASSDLDITRNATRAEVIRIMFEAAEVTVPAATKRYYEDVPLTHEFYNDIAYATELGLVSGDGTGNTFRPDAPVNRAEVAKIMNNVLDLLIK